MGKGGGAPVWDISAAAGDEWSGQSGLRLDATLGCQRAWVSRADSVRRGVFRGPSRWVSEHDASPLASRDPLSIDPIPMLGRNISQEARKWPLQTNTGRNETGAPATTTTLLNGARPTSGGTPILRRDWPPGSSDGDRQPANQRRWRARDEIGAFYVTGRGGASGRWVAVALSRRTRSVPRPMEGSFFSRYLPGCLPADRYGAGGLEMPRSSKKSVIL